MAPQGAGEKLGFGWGWGRNTQLLLLQGADLIFAVPRQNPVQRPQGWGEELHIQPSSQLSRLLNKLPSQENTLHSFFPLQPSQPVSQGIAFVYDNKAESMATHCDVMGV